MPDISMCKDHQCPSAKKCYRYMAKEGYYQYYTKFDRGPADERCDYFATVEGWPKKMLKNNTKEDDNGAI